MLSAIKKWCENMKTPKKFVLCNRRETFLLCTYSDFGVSCTYMIFLGKIFTRRGDYNSNNPTQVDISYCNWILSTKSVCSKYFSLYLKRFGILRTKKNDNNERNTSVECQNPKARNPNRRQFRFQTTLRLRDRHSNYIKPDASLDVLDVNNFFPYI